MCPNLESHSTVKRSTPSHSDNRFVSSSTKPAGDNIIGGKKEQQQQQQQQQRSAKAPRRIGIFNRQHNPRSVHNKQCAMETAKIADSSGHHLSPPSPVLHRWGSITSQDSYKATSSKSEQELRKCLGSEYDEEILLKSYSCAWQKDILVHGRLYITHKWFCFYSSILGFETKTCISCMDVTAIRKHKTAKVIPNAIQIETGDKKYGFSSFYHRDKTYLVLITVWQNALTKEPLSVDSLRQELKTLKVTKEQEKLIMGRRSKSASINSDASVELDTSVAIVADSTTSTPVHPVCHSSTDTITNPTEESDFGDEGEGERTTGRHYQSYHNTHRQGHTHNSSPYSSRSGSPSEADSDDNESNSSKSGDSEEQDYEEGERRGELDSTPKKNGKKYSGIPRSPSLVTLRSESPREVGVARVGGGGSPNIFHHWKQTWSFSSAWRRVTLVRPVEVVRRPIRFVSMCSTSQLINLFISIAIIFMFVYMLTMFCHLSQVNPSLQPYLKFQPWCSLCSSSDYPAAVARTTGGSTHQQAMDQQLSRFLLPTTTDTGSNRGGGDGGASASSFRSPCPSVLPTT